MRRLKIPFARTPLPHQGGEEVIVNINTTPLIDVMLVLLVMLIITIPLQTQSVQLSLSQGEPPSTEQLPPFITVGIDFDNSLTINNKSISSEDELQQRFRDIAAQAEQPEVHIKPDRLANYKTVAIVLADAQRLGVKKIGIINQD